MVFIGLLITLLGFVITLASLGIAGGTGARMALVILGNLISLFGIMGLLNRAFLKNAIWRR